MDRKQSEVIGGWVGLKSVDSLMRGCIRMMAKDRTVTTVPVVFQRTSYEMVFTKFRTSVNLVGDLSNGQKITPHP